MGMSLEELMTVAIIVLISGKKYSGKDVTAAIILRILRQIWGSYVAEVIPFARELKRQYADTHGLDFERLMTDTKYKELHRPGLIALGAEKRLLDVDYWCSAVLDAFKLWVDKGQEDGTIDISAGSVPVLIVPDVRFPNESKFFNRYISDGSNRIITIRLEVDLPVREARGLPVGDLLLDDVSETSLDGEASDDFLIKMHNNYSTEEEFAEALQERIRAVFPAWSTIKSSAMAAFRSEI